MKFEILKPQSFCVAGKDKAMEDAIFPEAGAGTIHDKLFIVADGMGGQGKGNVASGSLCRSIPDYLFQNTCSDEPLSPDLMQLTLLHAYKHLAQDCSDGGGVMYAMVYFHRQGVMAAHVGNSRIYHYRPSTHTLLYKSRDDFKAATADMVQPIEPTRKNITNVRYGDYFVLLTKGAHSCIPDDQLFAILNEGINDEAKLRKIRQLTEGAKEDATVSLVRVSGVMIEAVDEQVAGAAGLASAAAAPAPKPQPKPQPQPQPQPQPKPQPKPIAPVGDANARPALNEDTRAERFVDEADSRGERKKGASYLVPITALVLVGLAVGLYFWSKSQFAPKEEEDVVVVKKDTVRKDTINIMRNENAKSKANDDLFKLPEVKKEEEQQKQETEEKRRETVTAPDMTAGDNGNNATPNAGETTTTPPSAPTPPPTSTPTPAPSTVSPPADNPAPATVEPRSVIPANDDEN